MTIRARRCALSLALLAACASTGELDADTPDGGGTAIPPGDASTPPKGGGIYDGGPRDAGDAGLTPRICSDDDFCHSAVAPGTHFRGVWGDGTGVVWAVTLEQDILRWDGASWNLHHHSDDPITAIWGSGPTDLWVVAGTTLLHGTGESSAQVAFNPTGFIPGDQAAPVRAVWGTGPLDVWAVGGAEPAVGPMRARVLRYSDDPDLGLGWQLDRGLSDQPISYRGVCGTPETGLWVWGVGRLDSGGTSNEPRVLHQPPGASTWTSITLPQVEGPYQISEIGGGWTTSDGSVWLIGKTLVSSTFLFQGTSSDAGTTFDWAIRSADLKRPVHAMWGAANDDLWAVGRTGLVARWNGSKFSQAAIRVNNLAVTQSIWAIWGTSSDDFWVVGDEIALHRTHGGKP